MHIEEDYDFVKVPSKDMDLLMETVSLDGSYSFDLKRGIRRAMENIKYFSSIWVVLTKNDEKQSHIKAFVWENDAQAYYGSLDYSQDYIIVRIPIF